MCWDLQFQRPDLGVGARSAAPPGRGPAVGRGARAWAGTFRPLARLRLQPHPVGRWRPSQFWSRGLARA
eukprot:2500315-Alexandrium_andersonii.AAC.1